MKGTDTGSMPRDKTLSHRKIMQSAMEEFSEYGYEKASMRRIGSRCGLTAAALYRHFDNKEAMFDSLVRPAVEDLRAWIDEHISMWESAEIDMMRELIYPRMDEYALLINKSHGSRYSNFLNDLVEYQQKRMMPRFIELKKLGYDVKDVSEEELHMLSTAYCTALFEPVVHNYSLEDAVRYLDTVEAFFMPGWKNLMGIK